MPPNRHIPIEGEFLKRWRLYRVGLHGEQLELLEHADTREELDVLAQRRKPRADWRVRVFDKDKQV